MLTKDQALAVLSLMIAVLLVCQSLPQKFAALSIFLAASAALIVLALAIYISFCLRCPRCSGWIAIPKCPACGLKLENPRTTEEQR